MNSCDILCFAPHPDDAELCCGGLLLKAARARKKLVVVDITRGEMGTRGSPAIREREAAAATRLLKLRARENLGFPDGHLHDDDTLRAALVHALRTHRPKLLLIPHWEDQHPDHAAVGQAGLYAAWLCGAPRYAPESGAGVASAAALPYRPAKVLHYNNRYGIQADVVVDISDVIEEKLKLVACFQTQFGAGASAKKTKASPAREFQTRLSNPRFIEWLKGMHSYYGYQTGVDFGEAYCIKGPLGISGVDAVL